MMTKQNKNLLVTKQVKKKNLKVGDIGDFKITAFGANQIAIDDYSYSFNVLILSASYVNNLGDLIKAKIIKLEYEPGLIKGQQIIKFAIAKIVPSQTQNQQVALSENLKPWQKIKVADVLNLPLTQMGKNLVAIQPNGGSLDYKIFVLNANSFDWLFKKPTIQKALPSLEIEITRVKSNYAFAKLTSKQVLALKQDFGSLSSANQKNKTMAPKSMNDLTPHTVSLASKSAVFWKKKRSMAFRETPSGFNWTSLNQLASYKNSAKFNKAISSTFTNSNYKSAGTPSFLKQSAGTPSLLKSFAVLQNSDSINSKVPLDKQNYMATDAYALNSFITESSYLTLTLPKKAKRYACLPNHVVLKLANTVVFLKLNLGACLGNRVKIKFTKVLTTQCTSNSVPGRFSLESFESKKSMLNSNLSYNIAIAKVISLNPMTFAKKRLVVKNTVRQMLKSGMHFGEKATKCNARMKNYVWLRQKGQLKKKPLIKKGCNVINLLKTRRCLNKALMQLSKYAAKGRTFLFVATKKPAAALITRASLFSKTAFFVNTRWLGGMLTNCKTISQSISKIRPILKQKQIIMKQILIKRQNLKNRLIDKAILLRKKSKVLLTKGRLLWSMWFNVASKAAADNSLSESTLSKDTTLASNSYSNDSSNQKHINLPLSQQIEKKTQGINESSSFSRTDAQYTDNGTQLNATLNATANYDHSKNVLMQKNQKLIQRAEQLMQKTQNLFTMRQKLLKKKQQLSVMSELLNQKCTYVSNKFETLLTQVAMDRKKITQLKSLLLIAKQINKIKASSKDYNQKLVTLNYAAFKKCTVKYQNMSENKVVLNNPPKTILNKIVSIIRSCLNNDVVPADLDMVYGKKNPSEKKVVIVSALLSKFTLFIPYLRQCIKSIATSMQKSNQQIQLLKQTLNLIKQKLQHYALLKNQINNQLNHIKTTLITQRHILNFVKTKLKQQSCQIRLIKFLPKLRYLSTPQTKILQTVQILMRKIIDPKLKYAINLIYDQKLSLKSKKEMAARKKSWQRLEKYFGGIANMTKMKKNQINKNVAIIIGQQEEQNAVRECRKLGIKMFNMVDTNCNPNYADHFIPANDDSPNAIKYVLTKFLTRIRLAQKISVNVKRFKRLTA